MQKSHLWHLCAHTLRKCSLKLSPAQVLIIATASMYLEKPEIQNSPEEQKGSETRKLARATSDLAWIQLGAQEMIYPTLALSEFRT